MDNVVLQMILAEFQQSDSDPEFLYVTSSSSSEDEFGILNVLVTSNVPSTSSRKIPRITNYVERVIPNYTTQEFKSHFRVTRETFELIIPLIGPSITETLSPGGRKPIDAHKQLLLTLWVMATPDSLRSVCEKFNVGKATALRSVRRVCYSLHSLAPRFIKWPKGNIAKDVMEEFERNSGFPKVIGAIDGTHIRIRAPPVDAHSFINRKGDHSIQVQAVCTYSMLFTSVLAGHAGCVHDARVFRLSPVSGYFNNPNEYFPENSHLVGDAAYGIHSHLMCPFKDNGHLTARQRNFNFCLSSARISIERAFGLWKTRWRRILDCLPMTKLEKIPEFILATSVLHNICILNGDFFPYTNEVSQDIHRGILINQSVETGNMKRNQIMNTLIIRTN